MTNLGPESLLPPWEPRIPNSLASVGDTFLLAAHGITEHYSTARIIGGISCSAPQSIGHVNCDVGRSIVCEPLSRGVASYFDAIGVTPVETDANGQKLQTIQAAVSGLRVFAPCLFESVATLARRVHLIHSAGEEYDSSFSDPEIPFSIFISVPTAGENAILRTTESVVHEVCHLQLSLFERIVPLFVEGMNWTLYSPWKATERGTPGIVHGLYVFSILRWMWNQMLLVDHSEGGERFARNRIHEISKDIREVGQIVESPALTQSGRELVRLLLD